MLNTAARWSIALMGTTLLLWALISSVKWGAADMVLIQSMSKQDDMESRWARNGALSVSTDWQMVHDALEQAARWDAKNPAIAEQMGQLWGMRANSGDATDMPYARAVQYLSQAAILRPVSPYTWANLAWVKYQLGEVDNIFYTALENAIKMGPWEREVQMAVVDLGLALWDEMPSHLQPLVWQIVQNGLQRYSMEISRIAIRRGRQSMVCGLDMMVKSKQCEQESK